MRNKLLKPMLGVSLLALSITLFACGGDIAPTTTTTSQTTTTTTTQTPTTTSTTTTTVEPTTTTTTVEPTTSTTTTTVEEKFNVTFDTDGGSTVATQEVVKNGKATKPTDPTRGECEFKGWYVGDTEYNFNTPITADVTLKAKWYGSMVKMGGASSIDDEYYVSFVFDDEYVTSPSPNGWFATTAKPLSPYVTCPPVVA